MKTLLSACAALAVLAVNHAAGPVAAYALDEGAGLVTADASGNGNTGTLSGVTWTAAGKHNAALGFNGSSGSVRVAHSASVNLTGSFTLSAWVRPAALSGYQTILIKETTGNGSYWLQTLGGQVDSGLFDGATFREHVTTNASLAIGTWAHVASVLDAANHTFTIYLNGQLSLSEPESAAIVANTQDLVFGQSHVGERWNGLVDDVRLYNRALSVAEVLTDMNTPVGGTPPPPDSTPPTVYLLTPSADAAVWGVTTVSAVASDPDSGIADVQFRLDGADTGQAVGGPPFNFAWNTTTVAPGSHTWVAVARNGSGLTSTSSPVSLGVTNAPVRWLKPSADRRYLVDQDNRPFLIAGDAPQSLTVNVSTNEADLYFANRQARGFNALWVNLLCNDGTAGRSNGSTYDGILPFTGYLAGHTGDPNYYDLSRPNPDFFSRVDWMIRQAARYGLVFFLDPAETIGWLRNNGTRGVLLNNGTNACRAYGQFLGNRYGDFPNLVWMSGNDFQTWRTPAADAVVLAVALGIRDIDTNHLQTVELDYLTSGSLDDSNWAPIISLNASYTYYPTYAQVLKDYQRTNFVPVFLIEANYEFENLQGPVTTALLLRRQEYWALLSGAAGQFYGSAYTWKLPSGWQSHLDSPGALQMPNLRALFEPRAWYTLVPDTNHSVLTAGYGTFSTSGYVANNTYATAARTPDGSLVMVYLPTSRTITIDMTKLATPAVARWYDPSNGTYREIPGSPFDNRGTQSFTPPGANHDGDSDWVLVLETRPPQPVLRSVRTAGGDCVIALTTVAGPPHTLQRTDDLGDRVWAVVTTNVPGTGGTVEITDWQAARRLQGFYRAQIPM